MVVVLVLFCLVLCCAVLSCHLQLWLWLSCAILSRLVIVICVCICICICVCLVFVSVFVFVLVFVLSCLRLCLCICLHRCVRLPISCPCMSCLVLSCLALSCLCPYLVLAFVLVLPLSWDCLVLLFSSLISLSIHVYKWHVSIQTHPVFTYNYDTSHAINRVNGFGGNHSVIIARPEVTLTLTRPNPLILPNPNPELEPEPKSRAFRRCCDAINRISCDFFGMSSCLVLFANSC